MAPQVEGGTHWHLLVTASLRSEFITRLLESSSVVGAKLGDDEDGKRCRLAGVGAMARGGGTYFSIAVLLFWVEGSTRERAPLNAEYISSVGAWDDLKRGFVA
jgi:hypothetical protein